MLDMQKIVNCQPNSCNFNNNFSACGVGRSINPYFILEFSIYDVFIFLLFLNTFFFSPFFFLFIYLYLQIYHLSKAHTQNKEKWNIIIMASLKSLPFEICSIILQHMINGDVLKFVTLCNKSWYEASLSRYYTEG